MSKQFDVKTYQNYSAILFSENTILVNTKTQSPIFSFQQIFSELNIQIKNWHVLNLMLIIQCELIPDGELAKYNYQFFSVKPYLSTINPEWQAIILKAYHWMQWDAQAKFCGKCGNALKSKVDETEKTCSYCHASVFPRFSPAVCVAVKKHNQILLARSPHFLPGSYSVIAGFVDIGETAEMTVHRELREEVGIEVKNVKYVGSQTWPFPDSFMMAFVADYLSGELVIDPNELEDAQWFDIKALPNLPGSASISRTLIDCVVNEIA